MKKNLPDSLVVPGHPDFDTICEIRNTIYEKAGGQESFEAEFPPLIRKAIDEVIDTPRTGRLHLSDTEKTEKTYLGTKIEILVRDYLGLIKGRLDLEIDGRDVDVKNTVGSSWMIPKEAMGAHCLLIASDENTSLCYFGIMHMRDEYLTVGKNQDGKRSVSAEGFEHIYWLLKEAPYPQNFWSDIDRDIALKITDPTVGGTERLKRLFREIQNKPISRDIVASVARQKDYMKRLRKNGGARDPLLSEGIHILSGDYHADQIEELGLPKCQKGEFISVKISPENTSGAAAQ